MEEHEDKRFFVIMFTGLTKEKELQKGKMHMFTDGSYVNEAFIHKTIAKDFDLMSPFITNVIEMDIEDFADFTASEEDYKEVPLEEKTPRIAPPVKPTPPKDDLEEFI